jgi:hypothetical protein
MDFDQDEDDDDKRPFTWFRFFVAVLAAGLATIMMHYVFGVP